jgi:cytochrome c peroxidase
MRSENQRVTLSLAGAVALSSVLGCAGANEDTEASQAAALVPSEHAGRRLFERSFPHTNGRSCATCHVLDEATTLRPASVEARLKANPRDPLFNRIDADDRGAAAPTYEHLKKGLVRVVLPLPDNMDVVDFDGNVITSTDRTIFVWRGVPSIANTAITAPYQLDGRALSLQEQAQGAISSHSEGRKVGRVELDRIASFERNVFSSPRARFVSLLLERGRPLEEIPIPEDFMSLSDQERRGRELYNAGCQPCHGGATTDRIVNREVHDFLFPAITADGNVRFEVIPGTGPVPVRLSRPNVEFINVGYGITTYFAQIGLGTAFNGSVELPKYRFRFYEDGSRSRQLVDLPPVPMTVSGSPFDPRPVRDADGAPIVGPNLIPQLFTTDPGRAAVTGDPADFEAFDVPQLRGIAQTAPYFHDNSSETLRDVVDTYSRFVLPALVPLAMPAVYPPEQPGSPPEALSPAQKDDLMAFLRRL